MKPIVVCFIALCTLACVCSCQRVDNEHLQWIPKVPRTIPLCNPIAEREKVSFPDVRGVNTGTTCPNSDKWLNGFSQYVRTPPNIVVVGCNKGVDAVRLFAQYDGRSTPYRLGDWQSELIKQGTRGGVCGQVYNAKELQKPREMYLNSQRKPNVFCVEPMPANVKLLKDVATATQIPHQFEILPYAVGVSQWPRQLPFPNARAGTENLGLDIEGQRKSVMVNVTTVDQLFGKTKVDMLLVDTEGNDPLVLLGASKVLRRVSYLEFENHGVGEWKTFKLRTIIDYLDNFDFDCWWATESGTLVRITRCWHKDYASVKTWSNIACAKRFDDWWNVMNTLASS